MVDEGRARWTRRYAASDESRREPSPFVLAHALTLPARSLILDVAGGRGRNARALADHGRTVIVLDYVERAVALAREGAPRVLGVVADAGALPMRAGSVGGIICADFLDRDALPALIRLLAPGGLLIMETFTTDHLALVAAGRASGPSRRAHLLEPGELPGLVAPLRVVDGYEGHLNDGRGERCAAGVVAVREASAR
ncbi:MAG: methyltransferase domain-containing protein [Gemmatimonadaceae bacterium]